jgi:ribosome biogenesis GTPase
LEGIVIKSTGSWITVRHPDGRRIDCKLKGQFRIKGLRSTNPVAIGDIVDFEMMPEEATGFISGIRDRHNYIVRKAINLSKVTHILAANIDHAYLVVTLAFPRTSVGFIDRFLVTAAAYYIPASLIFNKTDLYDEKLARYEQELKTVYENAGYPCYSVSALTGDGVERVRDLLAGKINLFSGHSGAGKSALITAVEPGLTLKTGKISAYHHECGNVRIIKPWVCYRHTRYQRVWAHRLRKIGDSAMFPRDGTTSSGMPVQQLHPYPRAKLCGEGGTGNRQSKHDPI